MRSPAAESSSPPALSPRLAARPAAFHCRLFIRLNSLRFLSCSLRGTEGELVPADGPHPPHPAPLERGLEKRDAGEGDLPPLRGPRAACAPLPSKYGSALALPRPRSSVSVSFPVPQQLRSDSQARQAPCRAPQSSAPEAPAAVGL
ncbi:uncharacterized protein LOC131576194 isoform X2 [Poecile atricapillus]|uniref:uncharacterized protein LOC131576194 isoform X2 n=1 Tax=Poecile atricapillus TaxID=48891 RepID=UPI0027382AA3|nr:uncharacterized protein LOC131576194 isoform X2 [Poecile atricapillus]